MLDFRNAFNSIRHDKMLCAVGDLAPELAPFVFSAYSEPSSLFWRDTSLMLSEGVQQRDPLEPLLLCLTIHKLVSQLGCELCLFCLDDGTLGGNPEQVVQDLHLVEEGGKELGLSQPRKVWGHQQWPHYYRHPFDLSSQPPSNWPIFCHPPGFPLGDIAGIGAAIQDKLEFLRTMEGRLNPGCPPPTSPLPCDPKTVLHVADCPLLPVSSAPSLRYGAWKR